MEAAHRAALNAAGALAGRVTIGFDGAGSYTLIPRLIEQAARLMPELDIAFVELSSIDQMREVEFHRLDIGLVRPLPHDAAILTEAVFSEPLALAVPAGHRLAGRRSPRLSDLDGEPFVAYSEAGRYLRDLIDGECAAAGATPHIVQRMSRTHSILALVSTGLGVAIVPAGSSAAAFDNILFKPLPIATRAEWHAAWSRKAPGALVPAVLDLLRGLDR
ncbi:LysR substrate-binding domain-containing protein [Sphingomonas abietis]|uniref:LysR substrate-binding domain-containing protein n=1 Tax=Sphingomonas abietis TaxID=3012344 RepID=A0ABY7NGS0_9SPHN|nr:LysR substrate-binding domain-containing protein [Sphingomonas abietis]WBO20723.1 LysR substrate-binding domain-containing protein [Sphingomonas abietis]